MRAWFSIAFLAGVTAAFAGDVNVSFNQQIQPILESRCLKCHGPAIQLGKLDLRSRATALTGGEHGAAIVPGKADASPLYRRIAGIEKPAMPLDGALTAEQVSLIRTWLNQGAAWDSDLKQATDTQIPAGARDYWAFRRPVKTPPPAPGNPIDAFLEKTWRDKGLKPAPPADRVTLLRRAFLDLTGLPPTTAEASAYLDDNRADAWERLIDRLLESPYYGERWGRHWLDVARYADSMGFEHDIDRPNAWRYRDYVVQAVNADKPFDVFLREQIAGDEIANRTYDSLIATGFLRVHAKVGYREKDNPENRFDYLDDMIATLGRGVLGLTVQCARCHDHKFDPIPQKDYYRLQALLWPYVEVEHPLVPREQAEAYAHQTASIDARLAGLREQVRAIEKPYRDALLQERYKKYPQNIQDAIATPEDSRTEGQKLLATQVVRTVSVPPAEIERIMQPQDLAVRKKLTAEIAAVEKERPAPIPMAMGITDGDYRFTPDGPGDEPAPGKGVKKEATDGSYVHTGLGRYTPPPSYLLIRGDPNSKGPLMQPGFISVATYGNPPTELPPPTPHTSGRRLALAEWLVSRENPLTARVAINRIWLNHFGRGLVATADNFGKMGDEPSHPQLLDWLAVEFMDRGWSYKQMHRLIMNSRAYRMSSAFADPGDLATDGENRYLWRYRIQRMDAETVRDSILAVSGGLNTEMGGPPVFPKLDADTLASMTLGLWKREEDGPKVWRRSVYVYRKRGLPFPFFEAFDLPDQNLSCAARTVSTVPTQALMLLNDDFVLKQAKLFAGRVREAAPNNPERQVELAYRLALSRPPGAEERKLALDFVSRRDLAGLTHVILNLNEFLYAR